jgi:transcriptional regulator with XRE-family HTH domain
MAKSKITVAQYLSQQIALSPLSQREIAERAGYTKPNILTMFKQGDTKVPVNKVPALAKALGVDSMHMLRIVLEEYMPEAWAAMESILGKHTVTDEEMSIIELVRQESRAVPLDLANPKNEEKLRQCIAEIAAAELKDRDSAVRLVDAMPRNARKAKVGA